MAGIMFTISPTSIGDRSNLKISDIECHVLLAPDYDPSFTSSGQDSLVVFIHTDAGISGIGECDANPWMAKTVIEAPGTHTMGLAVKEMLIGADPFEIGDLWNKIYTGTAMNGRRGMVIHALSAIDMALWDLCGKAVGKPVHELLGGATRDRITPYASLQPAGSSFEAYRDALVKSALDAKALGFKALKSEVTMNGPYAHNGMEENYDRHTEVIAAVREAIGPDITLMVDVQYLWSDAETCLSVVKDWAEFDLFFLETPINSDNVKYIKPWIEGQNIVSASDLVICKCGYGMISECLTNETPFLYISDDNHLEQKAISEQLEEMGFENRLTEKDLDNLVLNKEFISKIKIKKENNATENVSNILKEYVL